jgi:hypothetical protein
MTELFPFRASWTFSPVAHAGIRQRRRPIQSPSGAATASVLRLGCALLRPADVAHGTNEAHERHVSTCVGGS